MGHEAIGVVEAVGKGVRNVKVGDVVVMPFAYSDGTCDFCHDGSSRFNSLGVSMKLPLMVLTVLAAVSVGEAPTTFATSPATPAVASSRNPFIGTQSDVTITVGEPSVLISGHGVWMGKGLVLTAQHLFRSYKAGDAIHVTFRGETFPATLFVKGSLPDTDLAVLRISTSAVPLRLLESPAPSVCPNDERIGNSLRETLILPRGRSLDQRWGV